MKSATPYCPLCRGEMKVKKYAHSCAPIVDANRAKHTALFLTPPPQEVRQAFLLQQRQQAPLPVPVPVPVPVSAPVARAAAPVVAAVPRVVVASSSSSSSSSSMSPSQSGLETTLTNAMRLVRFPPNEPIDVAAATQGAAMRKARAIEAKPLGVSFASEFTKLPVECFLCWSSLVCAIRKCERYLFVYLFVLSV